MNAEGKLVIDYYESLGLVRKIDSDRPVEQVSASSAIVQLPIV